MSNRARRHSTANDLAGLSADLEFLDRWVKLSTEHPLEGQTAQADSVLTQVHAELGHILVQYRKLKARDAEEAKKEIVEISFMRRMLVLFTPVSAKGWSYHTLFYVLVLFSIAMIVTDFQAPTYDPVTGESEFGLLVIGVVVLFGPPVFLFMRLANRDRARHIEELRAWED